VKRVLDQFPQESVANALINRLTGFFLGVTRESVFSLCRVALWARDVVGVSRDVSEVNVSTGIRRMDGLVRIGRQYLRIAPDV
jgi:hypothetical protein